MQLKIWIYTGEISAPPPTSASHEEYWAWADGVDHDAKPQLIPLNNGNPLTFDDPSSVSALTLGHIVAAMNDYTWIIPGGGERGGQTGAQEACEQTGAKVEAAFKPFLASPNLFGSSSESRDFFNQIVVGLKKGCVMQSGNGQKETIFKIYPLFSVPRSSVAGCS